MPISFAGKQATARPIDEDKLLAYAQLDKLKKLFAHAEIGKARIVGLIELVLAISREWKPENVI